MTEKNERIQILEMIESGVISAADGARLLQALDSDDRLAETLNGEAEYFQAGVGADDPEWEPSPQSSEGEQDPLDPEVIENVIKPSVERWKRWWVIPLWIGVAVTVAGSLLMLWAYQSTGFSFWFGCAWLPFLMGVAIIAMAWGSRSARWLHLRVQQVPGEWPQTIALSFPLPLHFAAWVMRTFGQFIPKINGVSIDFDQVIQSFEEVTTPETPFYIEVDEGDHGEKVQIYIG